MKTIFRLRLERPTTRTTYFCLLISTMLVSLALGIYLFTLPANQQIMLLNYGNKFGCREVLGSDTLCETTISVEEDIEGPILINYELTNFISNSKDYLLSKSHKQLSGSAITIAEAKQCEPYVTNEQMEVSRSWAGAVLDPAAIASPCGLQAKLWFRDTFELVTSGFTVVPIRTNNLIKKFSREPNSENVQWVDPTSDSFEIWMTTTISPTLLKLYGVIDQQLARGNYTLRIKNRSNYSMEVEKNLMFVH